MTHAQAHIHRMFELVEPIATVTFSAAVTEAFLTLRPQPEGECHEDVGLGAADALSHEDGVVAVAPVLAQQRRRVPEPGDWFLRYGERSEPGVQRPPLGRRADRGSGCELGDPRQIGGVGEATDPPTQLGGAGALTHDDCLFRGGFLPDPRNVACHLAVGEVVEDCVHHLCRSGPQRGGPAREVSVPVVAHAEEFGRINHLPEAQVAAVVDGLRDRGLVNADGEFTDAGRETRERIEFLTDELAAPAYEVLSARELEELLTGLEPITAAVSTVADD